MLIGNPSNFNISNVPVITLCNYSNNTVRQALLVSHCTDEETEAPRDCIICSVLHYYVGGCTLGPKSRSIGSQSFGLTFLVYSLFVLSLLLWYMYHKDCFLKQEDTSWFLKCLEAGHLFDEAVIHHVYYTLSKAAFVGGRMAGSFH